MLLLMFSIYVVYGQLLLVVVVAAAAFVVVMMTAAAALMMVTLTSTVAMMAATVAVTVVSATAALAAHAVDKALISSFVASRDSTTCPLKFSVLPASGWLRSIFTLSSLIARTRPRNLLPSSFCNGTMASLYMLSWSKWPLMQNISLSRSSTCSCS